MSTIGGRVRLPFSGDPRGFNVEVYRDCRTSDANDYRGRAKDPQACDAGKRHAKPPLSGVDGFSIDEATGMTVRGGIRVKAGSVTFARTRDGLGNYAEMMTEPENQKAHKRDRMLTVLVAGDTSDYDGFIALRPYVRHALRTKVRVRIVLAVNYPAFLNPARPTFQRAPSTGLGFDYGFEEYRAAQIDAGRALNDPDPSAWLGADASEHRQALYVLARLLAEEAIEDALEGGDRRLVELIVVHGGYNEITPFRADRYENEFKVYGEKPSQLVLRERSGNGVPLFLKGSKARANAIVSAIVRGRGETRDDLVFDLAGPCSFFTDELAKAMDSANLRPRFVGAMGGVECDAIPKTMPPSAFLNRLRASTQNQFYAPSGFERLLDYARERKVPIVLATNNAVERILWVRGEDAGGVGNYATGGAVSSRFLRSAIRFKQYYIDQKKEPAKVFDLLSTTAILAFLHVPAAEIFRQSHVYYNSRYGATIVTERNANADGGRSAVREFLKNARAAFVPDNPAVFPPALVAQELQITADLRWTREADVWTIDAEALKRKIKSRRGFDNALICMDEMMEGGWYDQLELAPVGAPVAARSAPPPAAARAARD